MPRPLSHGDSALASDIQALQKVLRRALGDQHRPTEERERLIKSLKLALRILLDIKAVPKPKPGKDGGEHTGC